MTTECEAKNREVVSESLLQQNPNPSVGPEFYKPFCLGLPEWCPCCIKMAEQQKAKLLSLNVLHLLIEKAARKVTRQLTEHELHHLMKNIIK